MITDKEKINALKKERGKAIFTEVSRVSGCQGHSNMIISVPLYGNGIYFESLASIKGIIPIDSIANVESDNRAASTYKIIITTTENTNAIELVFEKPQKGLTYYTKLRELIGTPLAADSLQSESYTLKQHKEDEQREKREKQQAELETHLAALAKAESERPETRKEKIKRLQAEDNIYCPKCLSTQITTNQKGFSVGQAITFGVLAGFVGSKKIVITCLSCGNKFKPGDK